MKNQARLLIDKLNEEEAKSLANGLLALLVTLPAGSFLQIWRFAMENKSSAQVDVDFAMNFILNECKNIGEPPT